MRNASLLSKGGLGYTLLSEPIGQSRGGRGGGVLPDTLILEIAVKCLDVQRGQILQTDMPDGLIDTNQVSLIV